MARDAKNLDSAKGMVTDDAMKQVLTSTYDRRVRCTPMLGRSYWPMLAMLSLPYAGYAGLNKRVEYQHTRVLTGYRGAHPPARSASPFPQSDKPPRNPPPAPGGTPGNPKRPRKFGVGGWGLYPGAGGPGGV